MKQQCHLSMIYCTWLLYIGGLVYLGYHSLWSLAAVWLIGVPLAEWLYSRKFPSLSPFMGYGRIADESGQTTPQPHVKVTLYTALGCPFCPLIEERLEELQRQTGFVLEKIDVTLRPDLLANKGIRSVPAVEIGGKLLVGLQTSRELAAALAPQQAPVRQAHA